MACPSVFGMSAAPVVEPLEAAVDDVLARLLDTQAWLSDLVAERDSVAPVSEAARIDRLATLERLQASVEAAKCVEMVAFARSRAVEQVAPGCASAAGRAGDC